MQMHMNCDRKVVTLWMPTSDKQKPKERTPLSEFCARCKSEHYAVAIFESGQNDLYSGTLNLLASNKSV